MGEKITFHEQEPLRDEWGNDLSLLLSNLRLTPEQRLVRHQSALDLVLELNHAGKQLRYGTESASKDSR